jgi:phosphate:Na+ symporter
LFVVVNDNPLTGLLVGAAVTMLVQASAATVGLTMAMASQGLLSLPAAIAVILGDNIGTTITAVLASLGGNRAAKQAAAAHVLFNVFGAAIMMVFLTPFTKLVSLTSADAARQVANSHSIFNILNTCIFLPFTRPYTRFIKKIIPDDRSAARIQEQGARYLDNQLIEVSPAAGVDAVRMEMVSLGRVAYRMIQDCYSVIVEGNTKLIPDIFLTEKTINQLNHAIIAYSTELGQRVLSPDLSLLLNSCTSGIADIERIGDHGENLIELVQFMMDRKLKLSPKAIMECKEMFDLVLMAVEKSVRAIETEDYDLAAEVVSLEAKVDQMEKVLRARHIERLNSGKCHPSAGIAFIDILSNLERVGDHAHNLSMIVKDIQTIHRKQVK